MIFVTVGTELPFDRLVRVVDEWACEHRRADVFAQIGCTRWHPRYIPYAEFLEPPEFNCWFARATTVVAHAGMGTILSALRYEKPILVMPRRAVLGEQRYEHQLATAKRLLDLGKINVALDETELRDRLLHLEELQARAQTGAFAPPTLTAALREFVLHGKPNGLAVAAKPAPVPNQAAAPFGRLA
jgi:UDP-N-acetylglucosamine transferase subunit ALG13